MKHKIDKYVLDDDEIFELESDSLCCAAKRFALLPLKLERGDHKRTTFHEDNKTA